ncbi:sensor histidine kinase [Paenibacillus thermotolerans]|uniref:sensor histidine kinase n=1 Tax=Paenibacillus thermotolerans TaxID=3027807 RepID=UPI002367A360|nr:MULTISPECIES: histidine kinase [unclassified Paenibacillus]
MPAFRFRGALRSKLYVKLIAVFVVITNVSIISLSYFMFYFMSQSVVRGELDKQMKAMETVNRMIAGKYEFVQSSLLEIYRNDALSYDVLLFLRNSYPEYVEHRLNHTYESDVYVSPNTLDFVRNKLQDDPDIESILLYSTEMQYLYAVYRYNGVTRFIPANAAHSFVPDVMTMEGQRVSAANIWIRRAAGLSETRLFAVSGRINDMNTLQNIGTMMIMFNTRSIDNVLNNFQNELKGYILALGPEGEVIYDSSGRYYGTKYPFRDQINVSNHTAMMEQESYITTLTGNAGGYHVAGIAPKREVEAAYAGLRNRIVMIAAVCSIVTIVIPAAFIVNFAKRTNGIIRLMRQVETGNLKLRIHEDKDDELGQISKSFNKMLDELSRYIDRVYKAEINQRRAELAAIQTKVNPHFLYNTLEVIRMRALSQGATDVGEMIYSLALLFKHMVRQQTVHSFKDEMESCRLYLELFRIRYKNKFTYTIEWEPQLASKDIISMSLQPIAENYIVHGIEPDRNDNFLHIQSRLVDGTIVTEFRDNGSGIAPDRLEEIRRSLLVSDSGESSFGLRSVYDRLRLFYGSGAELDIRSELGSGTIVTVTIPSEKGEESLDV